MLTFQDHTCRHARDHKKIQDRPYPIDWLYQLNHLTISTLAQSKLLKTLLLKGIKNNSRVQDKNQENFKNMKWNLWDSINMKRMIKKRKGIALRVSSSSIQEESDKKDLNEIEEDDDFRFFVKRFNKFLRNKGNQRRSNINPKKKGEDSSLAPKCYECDQPGHLRFDCLIFKR